MVEGYLMDTTAYFIKDRALSLAYEAVKFPATGPAALRWLNLAQRWAGSRGLAELAQAVSAARIAILTHATTPEATA